jgi:ABC-type bacteriocin/lantibiotic exporter with double-glycine peptidase domain
MILAGYGIRVPLSTLTRRLRTNTRTGTARAALIRVARSYGLSATENRHARIADIRSVLDHGTAPIVLYQEPDGNEGHYAIAVGLERGRIVLNDPWNGRNFRLARSEFVRRWRGSRKNDVGRWLLVVRTKKKTP